MSEISVGDGTQIEDWDGGMGTGFVYGENVESCKCSSGYMGERGSYCSACPQGKYKTRPGNVPCSDCEVGQYSSCEDTDLCGSDGEPAKVQCDSCEIGKYQSDRGEPQCESCHVGFRCTYQKMTYPVALPGFWVSPVEPQLTSKCEWGAEACPGGDATTVPISSNGESCTEFESLDSFTAGPSARPPAMHAPMPAPHVTTHGGRARRSDENRPSTRKLHGATA